MICSSNFKDCIVYCPSILLPAVRSLHHHNDMHFNQFPTSMTTYQRCLFWLHELFTPAKAFRVPMDTQNSVMLSCFDSDSLCSITSKMGWEGWKENKNNKKKTDKTPQQSVSGEKTLSCGPERHTHAPSPPIFCTFCDEYSKVKWFLITENCFLSNWVTSDLYCFFGVLNDQCWK